LEQWMSLESLY